MRDSGPRETRPRGRSGSPRRSRPAPASRQRCGLVVMNVDVRPHTGQRVALSNMAGSAASGFVASMPIFEVKPSLAEGSIDEPRTSCRTTRPRSAWNRVAIAHSTSRSSKMSMSSSTMTTCFIDVWAPNAAMIAFLPSPWCCLRMETTLAHVFGFGGDREAVLDRNHVDGLAEARLGERGGDPTLVDAILDGCPAGEEIPWVEADAHGDLEFPAGLRRLVVHVTQVTGDDSARAPIRAQDEDAMEREVPHALPLGDPDAGRDVPARVLREEFRDRQFPEVDGRRLLAQEVGTGHDLTILQTRLRLHDTRMAVPIRK